VKRLLFAGSIALVTSLVGIAACKQGEGDRCQIDADCASGLLCNKAKNTCQATSGGDLDADVIDAAITIDAPTDVAGD